MIELYKGDCLAEMDKLIAKGVLVDAIICDPPYGTTACKWDSVIPFDKMWIRLNKLVKSNSAIVLFGSEPFSSALRMSNIKHYKYDWIWNKRRGANFANVKYMPFIETENVSVFYKKLPTYNPERIMRSEESLKRDPIGKYTIRKGGGVSEHTGIVSIKRPSASIDGKRMPKNIITFDIDPYSKRFHPTQKPVALMEYLIKTYTNEGDTVLDFTMGSGTTLVACVNTNRNGIGIELDDKYFAIAEKRIKEAEDKLSLFKGVE